MNQVTGCLLCRNVERVTDPLWLGMNQLYRILFLIAFNIIPDDCQGGIRGIRVIDDMLDILIRLALDAFQGAPQEFFTITGTGDNADFWIWQGSINRHTLLDFRSGRADEENSRSYT